MRAVSGVDRILLGVIVLQLRRFREPPIDIPSIPSAPSLLEFALLTQVSELIEHAGSVHLL